MNKNFLDNFYGVLFSPDKTLNEIKERQPILQAFVIVTVISLLNVLLYSNYAGGLNIGWFGVNLFFSAFSGLISWVFFAAFFEFVANVFDRGGKFKTLLVLSAFALLPWIFLGPVELFKSADTTGNMSGVLLGLLVWFWVLVLQVIAVSKTYELKLGKTIVFIIVPLFGWFVFFNWFIGFFATLGQLVR